MLSYPRLCELVSNNVQSLVKITHYSYRYIYVIYDTPKLPLENLLTFESQNRFMTTIRFKYCSLFDNQTFCIVNFHAK